MPYKSFYTLNDFWGEMTQASWYQKYAAANPAESAAIAEHVQKKIDRKADFIPIDLAATHMGKALVYAMLTLVVA